MANKSDVMLVSVIIPVFNCEKFIDEAIKSVLSQNYESLEIIIIDDGSTDKSAEIIKNYKSCKIKYIYQENGGPASARNRGIKSAKGNFIAFLDADDLWPENNLKLQLSNFVDDINLSISMGRIKYIELPDAKRNNRLLLDADDTFKYINLGAGLFKKSIFDKVGLFNPDFVYWEDLDWFLRAYEEKVSIKFLDEVTMIYRIHSKNMSNNTEEKCNYFLNKAIRNSLIRRKKRSKGKVPPIKNFLKSTNNKNEDKKYQ